MKWAGTESGRPRSNHESGTSLDPTLEGGAQWAPRKSIDKRYQPREAAANAPASEGHAHRADKNAALLTAATPPGRSGEVGLELELALPQVFHLALGRHVLPQQLQLLHLQPSHLALQAVQLAGYNPSLNIDHGNVAGDDLLALWVKNYTGL